MGLQRTFAGGIVGLILTYMAWIICDTLFTGGDTMSTMISILVPLAFGFGTVMYVIMGAFKGD
jgi:hypothetical protein